MRTKNARAIDADEAAWLADVKSVPCVFSDKPPPGEAHHVKQGRHFCTVATSPECHAARVWRLGKMTELDAVNETIRRVVRLRAGKQQQAAPALRVKSQKKQRGTSLSSSKICKRPYS
jgi:hypothetical protein